MFADARLLESGIKNDAKEYCSLEQHVLCDIRVAKRDIKHGSDSFRT
jgi:hypothetical protein